MSRRRLSFVDKHGLAAAKPFLPAGVAFAARAARLLGIVLLVMNVSDFARAEATHIDGRWVFENDAIRVTVNETTATWDVLDKRCDRLWRQAAAKANPADSAQPVATPIGATAAGIVVKEITALPSPGEGVEIKLEYGFRRSDAEVPLSVRLSLAPNAAELHCEISGDFEAAIGELTLPAPVVLQAAEGKLVIPTAAGLLWDVAETEWHGKRLGGAISMPWFGLTDLATGAGCLVVMETFDDAGFRGIKVKGEQDEVLSVQPLFRPQKGKLGYARRLLYHFADKGGYVAMAKRYRAYVKKAGRLKTLVEKRKERPTINRLVGAVNIYTGGDFQIVEQLKQLGVDRALVTSGYSAAQVRQMNDWKYLTGRYDIYTDLYKSGTPPSKWKRCEGFTFPDDVIKRADGSNQVGWCPIKDPKTGEVYRSYVICTHCGLRVLREKMPKRLEDKPLSAYFLDCTTSAGLYECFDPKHPMTRTTDRETRIEQFRYLTDELGLVVGSETGRDWAVHVADYFEGIMSTAAFFAAPKAIHELPFLPTESTPRYEDFGTNPARRVPLFQLVYGDCVETTWRWGDNSHRMFSLWARKDLLQMIHASMPMWVLWKPHHKVFRANTDRYKECYDNVCRWRRAVGFSEMTNHERLSKDALLQKSTFANGASVTVNFATDPRTLADGTTLPPHSFLIQGDAAELSGLPVGKPVQVSDNWQPRESASNGDAKP